MSTHVEYCITIQTKAATVKTNIGLYTGMFALASGNGYEGSGTYYSGVPTNPGTSAAQKKYKPGIFIKDGVGSPGINMDMEETGTYAAGSSYTFSLKKRGFADNDPFDLEQWLLDNEIQLINCEVVFYLVKENVFEQRWVGVIDSFVSTPTSIDFTCVDSSKILHKTFPPDVYTLTNAPQINKSNLGKSIPVVFGRAWSKLYPLINILNPFPITIYNGVTYYVTKGAAYSSGTPKYIDLKTGTQSIAAHLLKSGAISVFIQPVSAVDNGDQSVVTNVVKITDNDASGAHTTGLTRLYLEADEDGFVFKRSSDQAGSSPVVSGTTPSPALWWFRVFYGYNTHVVSGDNVYEFAENESVYLYDQEANEYYRENEMKVAAHPDGSILILTGKEAGFKIIPAGANAPAIKQVSTNLNTKITLDHIHVVTSLGSVNKTINVFYPGFSPTTYALTGSASVDITPVTHPNLDHLVDGTGYYLEVVLPSSASNRVVEPEITFLIPPEPRFFLNRYTKHYIQVKGRILGDVSSAGGNFAFSLLDIYGDVINNSAIFSDTEFPDVPFQIDGSGYFDHSTEVTHILDKLDTLSQKGDFAYSQIASIRVVVQIPFITRTSGGQTCRFELFNVFLNGSSDPVTDSLVAKVNGGDKIFGNWPLNGVDRKIDGAPVLTGVELIEHIMRKYDGIDPAKYIDMASFDDALSQTSDFVIGRQITDPKSSQEILKQICKEGNIWIGINNDGKRAIRGIDFTDASPTLIDASIISEDSKISFADIPVRRKANTLTLNYNKNPLTGNYDSQIFVRNTDQSSFNDSYVSGIVSSMQASILWDYGRAGYLASGVITPLEIDCDFLINEKDWGANDDDGGAAARLAYKLLSTNITLSRKKGPVELKITDDVLALYVGKKIQFQEASFLGGALVNGIVTGLTTLSKKDRIKADLLLFLS